MLAGLYVFKVKIENRDDLPLLSVIDVRELVRFFLPVKVTTLEDLMTQIKERHRLRLKSYLHSRANQEQSPPHVLPYWEVAM